MLADDDQGIQTLVGHIVREEGHEFCCASDGEAAIRMVDVERPDLLILDIMMPRKDGFEVCEAVRAKDDGIPILILTAKGDIVDKSIGFRAGADDYLVKPFMPKELSLRIEALLRRRVPAKATGAIAEIIGYGELEIDVRRRRVTVAGQQADLTPKEFHLLFMLASSPGTVFTKDQLVRDIWGPEYVAESSSITVIVRRIREKIEKDPSDPQYLQTVWHVGYRFGD